MGCRAVRTSRSRNVAQMKYRANGMSRKKSRAKGVKTVLALTTFSLFLNSILTKKNFHVRNGWAKVGPPVSFFSAQFFDKEIIYKVHCRQQSRWIRL